MTVSQCDIFEVIGISRGKGIARCTRGHTCRTKIRGAEHRDARERLAIQLLFFRKSSGEMLMRLIPENVPFIGHSDSL